MNRWAEVIGDPVSHSKSPAIHRFWLRALGMDGDYRATRVTADQLAAWAASRRADRNWAGANVTMPLKEAVLPLLDEISDTARKLDAVNTIVHADGRLIGHNTDVDGVAEPLLRHEKPRDRQHGTTCVQIIGAGGAARAAWIGAMKAGYGDFDFFNRTRERAVQMARLAGLPDDFGHGLDALGPTRDSGRNPGDGRHRHIIINASAMGMHGANPVPIHLADYDTDTLVFDMVYAPLETPLLADARRLGLRTIDGLEMLVGQAATAFRHFFSVDAPREQDAELRALLVA